MTRNLADQGVGAAAPADELHRSMRHRTVAGEVELLAPAGGPEPFAAAVAAGADAVYCGFGGFNARRGARNFDDGSFSEACRLAHLAGARVYVTVNVAIKDREMPEALELVRHAAQLGADAFIIQDWGLFSEVKRLMPELEVHVSTQANVHDKRGVEWCREHGADRVTLSRELSLQEIATIAETGVDLEVFCHGAICFCYSGLCQLSSFSADGRSANRGLCAQPCRLAYDLVDEDRNRLSPAERKRALCPKDNRMAGRLAELVGAGARSLKLEGRMKAPDYVYSVTDAYRRELDGLLAGGAQTSAEEREQDRQLRRSFNRDFTSAYFDGTSGDEMMSYHRSNNQGQLVGSVVSYASGSARVRLAEPVGAGDLLEIRADENARAFVTATVREAAAAGDTVSVDVQRFVETGSPVRLIRSQAAFDASDAALKRAYPRKRAVDVRITARLGEPFRVELACADGSARAEAAGFAVEAARTRAVTEEDLAEHVGRMGQTPFEARSFTVELDPGCGMGFSAVHRVRAEAAEALERELLAPYARRAADLAGRALSPRQGCDKHTAGSAEPAGAADGADLAAAAKRAEICALVTSPETAAAAREAGAARIYVNLAASDDLMAAAMRAASDGNPLDVEDLLAPFGSGAVPVLDEVSRKPDHARLSPWVRADAPVAVGTVSELSLAVERGAAPEIRTCLPVHNASAVSFLEQAGATGFWLSPELALDEVERIAPCANVPVGIAVWGAPRVMTSEHCVLQVADKCVHDCARCGLRKRSLYLRTQDDRLLPVRTDFAGRSRIYNCVPLDCTPQIPAFLAAGVSRFMVDATLLGPEDCARAVRRAARALRGAATGRTPDPRAKGTTSGLLFCGVA